MNLEEKSVIIKLGIETGIETYKMNLEEKSVHYFIEQQDRSLEETKQDIDKLRKLAQALPIRLLYPEGCLSSVVDDIVLAFESPGGPNFTVYLDYFEERTMTELYSKLRVSARKDVPNAFPVTKKRQRYERDPERWLSDRADHKLLERIVQPTKGEVKMEKEVDGCFKITFSHKEQDVTARIEFWPYGIIGYHG